MKYINSLYYLLRVPLPEKTLNRLEAEIIEFSDFIASVVLPEKLSSHPIQSIRQRPDLGG